VRDGTRHPCPDRDHLDAVRLGSLYDRAVSWLASHGGAITNTPTSPSPAG